MLRLLILIFVFLAATLTGLSSAALGYSLRSYLLDQYGLNPVILALCVIGFTSLTIALVSALEYAIHQHRIAQRMRSRVHLGYRHLTR